MSLVYGLSGLLLALLLLVSIHEFGHFWVARLCGVRVLRFSIGFGKPLCCWTDKKGTEFVLAPIPLGGYVKMFGEDGTTEVHPQQQAFSFAHKNVWQRLAIVLAGPAANLLLAILCYMLIFVQGTTSIMPIVDGVTEGSPAQYAGFAAGDRIMAIENQEIQDWQAVHLALFDALGDQQAVRVKVARDNGIYTRVLSLQEINRQSGRIDDLIGALGILPYPDPAHIAPRIGSIESGGRAEAAGLLPADLIVRVQVENMVPMQVTSWSQWVQIVRSYPEKMLEIMVERDQNLIWLSLQPAARIVHSQRIGYIGAGVQIAPIPEQWLYRVHYSVLEALLKAVEKTGAMIALTLDGMKKLLFGVLSIENIGGPVTIGHIAGQSLQAGFMVFVAFLAYLNISLAVINLLPIPMLDGGHAAFYLMEILLRRPLPETVKLVAFKVGMVVLGVLMSIALANDVLRLFT